MDRFKAGDRILIDFTGHIDEYIGKFIAVKARIDNIATCPIYGFDIYAEITVLDGIFIEEFYKKYSVKFTSFQEYLNINNTSERIQIDYHYYREKN